VPLKEERCRASLALEPGNQIRPRRILGVRGGLETGVLELFAEEADAGALVPGRVGRVEAEQLL